MCVSPVRQILIFSFLLLLNSCVAKFFPEIDEGTELLVVEGLITNKPEVNTIKLSKSLPMGEKSAARPQSGCIVRISDDLGNIYSLKEGEAGTYFTDPANFKGVIGRSYTLQISVADGNHRDRKSVV